MMMNNKPVIVIGASNIDIKGKAYYHTIERDSNIGSVEISVGGVGRNIAENLARIGANTIMLSAVGYDIHGKSILESLKSSNANIEHIIISKEFQTGTYIAILEANGDMYIAINSMEINKTINIEYVKSKSDIIKTAKFIVIDTNIDTDVIKYIIDISISMNIPICVDPVSYMKATKLDGVLSGIYLIAPNIAELKSLSKLDDDFNIENACDVLLAKGVKNIVVTKGEAGVFLKNNATSLNLKPFKTKVIDVTGAGDSFLAGLIYGLSIEKPIEQALKYGLAFASVTISSKKTVSDEISSLLIEKVIKDNE